MWFSDCWLYLGFWLYCFREPTLLFKSLISFCSCSIVASQEFCFNWLTSFLISANSCWSFVLSERILSDKESISAFVTGSWLFCSQLSQDQPMPLIVSKTAKMPFGKFEQESWNHVLQDEYCTQKLSKFFWQDLQGKSIKLVCALGFAFCFLSSLELHKKWAWAHFVNWLVVETLTCTF